MFSQEILRRLQNRNAKEQGWYKVLTEAHNHMLLLCESLEVQNSQLDLEQKKLKQVVTDNHHQSTSEDITLFSQQYKSKIYDLQQQVIELHDQKTEALQRQIALNQCLQDKEQELVLINNKLAVIETEIVCTRNCNTDKDNETEKLEKNNQQLRDSYQSLICNYNSLTDAYKLLEISTSEIKENLKQCGKKKQPNELSGCLCPEKRYKAIEGQSVQHSPTVTEHVEHSFASSPSNVRCSCFSVASLRNSFQEFVDRSKLRSRSLGSVNKDDASDYLNLEGSIRNVAKGNASGVFRYQRNSMRDEYWRNFKASEVSSMHHTGLALLPQKPCFAFDAHESDINTLTFSPFGQSLATAGADKRIKIWDVSLCPLGIVKLIGVLNGSNGAVHAVEFNNQGTLVLGAASDSTCRIWTLPSQQLKLALTGHESKVMASKFLCSSSRIVTGSYDKTLKIWDVPSGSCIKTFTAKSSCTDVAVLDSETIVSGHLDKTVKYWDLRCSDPCITITLDDRVTSLSLSEKDLHVLCSVRDDTLRVIDFTMLKVVQTLSHSGFHIGADFSKAVYSSDSVYAVCGSKLGSLFIWDVLTGQLQTQLKETNCNACVTGCSWNSDGKTVSSCGKSQKVIIWA